MLPTSVYTAIVYSIPKIKPINRLFVFDSYIHMWYTGALLRRLPPTRSLFAAITPAYLPEFESSELRPAPQLVVCNGTSGRSPSDAHDRLFSNRKEQNHVNPREYQAGRGVYRRLGCPQCGPSSGDSFR